MATNVDSFLHALMTKSDVMQESCFLKLPEAK